MRTVPDISSFFQPLKDTIQLQLFPGHPACSATERDLFSLPCRFSGLGLINPMKIADSQFNASQLITASLKELIIEQSVCAHPPDVRSIKAQVHLDRHRTSKEFVTSEVILINRNKQEFWDAIHLQYGWNLLNVPSHCVCEASFTINHAIWFANMVA